MRPLGSSSKVVPDPQLLSASSSRGDHTEPRSPALAPPPRAMLPIAGVAICTDTYLPNPASTVSTASERHPHPHPQQQQQQQPQPVSREQQRAFRLERTASDPQTCIPSFRGSNHSSSLLLNSISDSGSGMLRRSSPTPSDRSRIPGLASATHPVLALSSTPGGMIRLSTSRSRSQGLDSSNSTEFACAYTSLNSYTVNPSAHLNGTARPRTGTAPFRALSTTNAAMSTTASIATMSPAPTTATVVPISSVPDSWLFLELPPLLLHQLLQPLDQVSFGALRLVCKQTRDVVDSLVAEKLVAGKWGVHRLLRLCLPPSSARLETDCRNTSAAQASLSSAESQGSIFQDPSSSEQQKQQQIGSSEYSYYSLKSISSFSPLPHLHTLVLNFPDAGGMGSSGGGGRRSGGGGLGCAALVRLLTSGALLQLPSLRVLDLINCSNCGWHKETAMLIEESLLPPSLRVIRLSGACKLSSSPTMSLSSPSSYISPLTAWVTSLTSWRTSSPQNAPWPSPSILDKASPGSIRRCSSSSDPRSYSKLSPHVSPNTTSPSRSVTPPGSTVASLFRVLPRFQIHVVGPTAAPEFIHPVAGFFRRQPSSGSSTSFNSAVDRTLTPSTSSGGSSSVNTRSSSPTGPSQLTTAAAASSQQRSSSNRRHTPLKLRGNLDAASAAISRSLLCLGQSPSPPPSPPHPSNRPLQSTYYSPASLHLLDVDPSPDSLARLNLPTALTHLALTWSAAEPPPADTPHPLPPLTGLFLNLPLTLTQLLLPSRRLNPVEVRLLGQIPFLEQLEVLCLDLTNLPAAAAAAVGVITDGFSNAVVLPSLNKLVVHAYFNLSAPLATHFPSLAWLHMGRPNQVSDRAVCSSRLDLLRNRSFRGASTLTVLSLCGGGFPADFHDAMRDLSGLQELQLHGLLCGTWVDTLVGACRTLPAFTHLYLSRCAAYPSTHPRAAEQILAADWLDHPQLSICDARVDTEHQLLNHLTAPGIMQRIQRLTLAELPFLTENEVLRVVSRVPKLSRLLLRGCAGMTAPFLQRLSVLVERPEVSVEWVAGANGCVPGCAWSMV